MKKDLYKQEINNSTIDDTNKHELDSTDLIRSEVNFLTLPFFLLSKKNSKKQKIIEYKDEIIRNNKKLEIFWRVSSNVDYGLPTIFDKQVYKTIEQIINEKGWPVTNPITFTLGQICRILNIEVCGKNKNNIKISLKRIAATTIDSKAAFYRKTTKEDLYEDSFRLYERIVFKSRKLPNGTVAETNYLLLGSFYLESLNAFYTKRTDFEYYQNLTSDIARRLYELLGVKFYGSKKAFIYFDYHQLCSLLPIIPQKYLSDAKRYLKPAHEELKKEEFLEKIEWDTKNKNWIIRYYPGKKAIEELKKIKYEDFPIIEINKKKKQHQYEEDLHIVDKTILIKPELQNNILDNQLTSEINPIIQELISRGITKARASKVIINYSKQYPKSNIYDVLECFDYRANKNEFFKIDNKAGLLIKLIETNECVIENFTTVSEKKKQQQKLDIKLKIKKEQEKLKEKRKTQYEIYKQNEIDIYINKLEKKEYQKLLQEAEKIFTQNNSFLNLKKNSKIYKDIFKSQLYDNLITQNKISILSFEKWRKIKT